VGTVLDGPVPRRVLDLRLVDHAGRRTDIGSLRGRVVVLSDMSTLCQETCAVGTASMLQAARAVDRAGLGARVEFLSITLDPLRDDRRHLAAYRRQFGALPNWETLTGSRADLTYLWDKLGVWRRTVRVSPPYPRDWVTGRPVTTDIQHTDDLVFIDAHQRFRYLIDGPGSVPSKDLVPRRIYAFMDQQGHQNVRTPAPGSWSGAQVQRVLRWLMSDGGAS
jgi:protein SCO1/2